MRILALDFETGGLDPQRHGPVSLGVAVMDGLEVIHSHEWKIQPPTKKAGGLALEYDYSALCVSGSNMKALISGGSPERTVLTELQKLAADFEMLDGMIVSHNAVFDAGFLSQMVFRCGVWDYGKFRAFPEPLRGPWACTRRMASRLSLPDNKLDTVAAHFNLSRSTDLHEALEDCILAGRIYHHLIQP